MNDVSAFGYNLFFIPDFVQAIMTLQDGIVLERIIPDIFPFEVDDVKTDIRNDDMYKT
jgi:hypothetical protein